MKRLIKKILYSFWNRKARKQCSIGEDIHFIGRVSVLNSGNKENIIIGNHGYISASFQCLCGGKIKVGDHIYIGSGTVFQAKESIEIGDNVIISNDVLVVDNNSHPTSPTFRLEMSSCANYMQDERWTWKYADSKPIRIEDNVWIGKNAVIMKGVTVGKGAIVALRAVVTHDVPPYAIVAGNPARVVKTIQEPEAKI